MTLRDAAPTSRAMAVAVMVSMVAFLDSTVINLALPATEHDLGGGLTLQQWIIDGYLLAMAAAILPGGSISDLFGRVPVMRFGLSTFGVGSVLAAVAISPAMLITARIIQGLGAAFLVPGSLALINTVFDKAHRSAAIGVWTGWTGTAFALGPLLGGMCVDYLGWRWIFVLSAIPMAVGYALTFWLCPMSGRVEGARVDTVGVGLSAVGLTATVYALIESQHDGWTDPMVITPLVIGIAALTGFVSWQRRSKCPMLPLPLFSFRNFAAANLVTAFVYGALTLGSLAVALYTQEIGGYSATAAGLATLPIPALSFVFARHVGRIAVRMGPRAFVITGPTLAGIGLLMIRPKPDGFHAITDLIPGMTVLAIGLVTAISPLTAVTLASVPTERSGLASAINNAVARLAALISIGSIGLITGGTASATGFAHVLEVSAALFALGAIFAALSISNPPAGCQPVPCDIAALCRDRPGAQPALASGPPAAMEPSASG
ncbi:MFS transporter [Mycobacterium shimoidei]|uniref:EmrB/QacA family drug resistance transporter [Corallococcus coralloides DSM 2259] n=1 Tax=Mycobacterium shimoidei TaxID=29313 RepID=A0A375Z5E6_MYCSH|nr:MFS transporter [Mycobacterium shimoidei]SRX96235.1 EmrB/QacA family drug resistance transporter [Corallococcus coralloides DSM 2259] [Mycobacterium shimoidei]